jgi:hypothetical protein
MDSHRAPTATDGSMSLGGNNSITAPTTSIDVVAVRTTTSPPFPLLDLPVEILIRIAEVMDENQVILFAATNRACWAIYVRYILPRRNRTWERSINHLVFLMRDTLTGVACSGHPFIHQIDLDDDRPWNPQMHGWCENSYPLTGLNASGVWFAKHVYVRHSIVETILKFVRAYDRLDIRQRQYLARLLTPHTLPQAPYLAVYARRPGSEKDHLSVTVQETVYALILMGTSEMHSFKVQPQFELGVVMRRDPDAEGGLAPHVVAKTTWTMTRTARSDIPEDASFGAIRLGRSRVVSSAVETRGTGEMTYWPLNVFYNEVAHVLQGKVATMSDRVGEHLEWSSTTEPLWYAVDFTAANTVTITALRDLGGQGMPFTQNWLHLVSFSGHSEPPFDMRDLGEAYERDRWVAPE